MPRIGTNGNSKGGSKTKEKIQRHRMPSGGINDI